MPSPMASSVALESHSVMSRLRVSPSEAARRSFHFSFNYEIKCQIITQRQRVALALSAFV
jgi:hypothetical protein